MEQRYGEIEDHPIYFMEHASKKLTMGWVYVQSLWTGETAMVKESTIKNITTTYPLKN